MALADDITTNLGRPGIGLRNVLTGHGTLERLPEIVQPLLMSGSVALLIDDETYVDIEGNDVKERTRQLLDDVAAVTTVTLRGDVHADETTVQLATEGCADTDLVVTVGSGTLCDIGKVTSAGRNHVVVQTAASVNGFADDQSVLLVQGVKRTTPSAWPHALVVDGAVLSNAPAELNQAGLGDMISAFTAPADWYLSSILGLGPAWDPDTATMTRRHGDQLLGTAYGVAAAQPDALATLANFLTLSGISMGIAGSTAPSSGMEHTISHMLDMASGARGEPGALHGAQVGVATVLAAILWRRMTERIIAGTAGQLVLPAADDARMRIRAGFDWIDNTGQAAAECWRDYAAKLDQLRASGAAQRFSAAMRSWQAHADVLESLLEAPKELATALQTAGAPAKAADLGQGQECDMAWALRNCHLMRNRFTIADLAFLTGWWTDDEVASVLDEASQYCAAR